MHAALVALVAKIDLQGFETPAAYRWKVRGFNQRQRRVHLFRSI
jgi:hypothetical protein